MRKDKYKPWIMATLLFEFLFFMMPGINSTVNLFVLPVSNEIGMSRSAYSLSFTITSIVMVVIALFYGKIYKKIGAKGVLFLTAIFALIGCIICANAQNAMMVYIGAFFRGLVLALGSTAIAASVIVNWFEKYRGMVMGIVFSAVGFGGVMLMPVYTVLVASPTIGWRTTYYYIGIIVFITTFVAAVFIKNTPEDAGSVAFGYTGKSENEGDQISKTSKDQGMCLREAIKDPVFYGAVFIILLLNTSLYGTYAHLAAYLTQNSISIGVIGTGLGLLSLGVGGGKIIYGMICDRFGTRVMTIIAAILQIVSIIMLLVGKSNISIILGCTLLGLSTGSLILTVTLFAGIFGKKDYNIIVGIFTAILGLSWGIGPWITGLFFDVYGTYRGIYIIYTIFGLVTGLLSFMLPKQVNKH